MGSTWETSEMPTMAPPTQRQTSPTESETDDQQGDSLRTGLEDLGGMNVSQLRQAVPLQLSGSGKDADKEMGAALRGAEQEEDHDSDDDDAEETVVVEGVTFTGPGSLIDEVNNIMDSDRADGFRQTMRRLVQADHRAITLEYTSGNRTFTIGTTISLQAEPPESEEESAFYQRAIDFEVRNIIPSLSSFQGLFDGILAAAEASDEKKNGQNSGADFGSVGSALASSSGIGAVEVGSGDGLGLLASLALPAPSFNKSVASSSNEEKKESGSGKQDLASALAALASMPVAPVDPRVAARRAIRTELDEMANALEQYLQGDQTYSAFFTGNVLDISYWMDQQMTSGHTALYDPLATVDNDNWAGDAILDVINEVTMRYGHNANGVRILREEANKLR